MAFPWHEFSTVTFLPSAWWLFLLVVGILLGFGWWWLASTPRSCRSSGGGVAVERLLGTNTPSKKPTATVSMLTAIDSFLHADACHTPTNSFVEWWQWYGLRAVYRVDRPWIWEQWLALWWHSLWHSAWQDAVHQRMFLDQGDDLLAAMLGPRMIDAVAYWPTTLVGGAGGRISLDAAWCMPYGSGRFQLFYCHGLVHTFEHWQAWIEEGDRNDEHRDGPMGVLWLDCGRGMCFWMGQAQDWGNAVQLLGSTSSQRAQRQFRAQQVFLQHMTQPKKNIQNSLLDGTWQSVLAQIPTASLSALLHLSPFCTSTIGRANIGRYARAVASCLQPGGRFLLQLHLCPNPWEKETSLWLAYQDRYILSGADGCQATIHQYMHALERAGMHVQHADTLQQDAFWTWEAWLDNWTRNRVIVAGVYGEQKYREVEVYLVWTLNMVRKGKLVTYQLEAQRQV